MELTKSTEIELGEEMYHELIPHYLSSCVVMSKFWFLEWEPDCEMKNFSLVCILTALIHKLFERCFYCMFFFFFFWKSMKALVEKQTSL